jgi:predicted amidohydrolase YtcJ
LRPGAALIGNRLDDEALVERRLPDRHLLDTWSGSRPVLLYRYCGHLAVANSAALALAEMSDHPDGVLRETEIAPVTEALAPLRPELGATDVQRALAGLLGLGLGAITAIVSVTNPLWCEVDNELGTLIEVAPALPLEIEVLVIANSPDELRTAAEAVRAARIGNLSFLGWKEFADGALGPRTAALHEPFSDDPENHGVFRLDRDRAHAMALTCLALDGTVAVHAIGDAANDAVLDFYEELIQAGAPPSSLRIEHASMLPSSTRQRMGLLGITASVQPSFVTSEVDWLERRIGPRVAHTYAFGEMEAASIPLLGGSDAPVESPNPWPAIVAATSRGLSADSAYRLYGPPLRIGDPAHLIETSANGVLADNQVISAYRDGEQLELSPTLEMV